MKTWHISSATSAAVLLTMASAAFSAPTAAGFDVRTERREARIREVIYNPAEVIIVPVKQGVSTHVQLETGETIRYAASGFGANCAKPEQPWCIVAEEGSGHIFVKPREMAMSPNTLAVVTQRRSYSFEFRPVGDRRDPVMRLVVKATPEAPASSGGLAVVPDPAQVQARRALEAAQSAMVALAGAPRPAEVIQRRLASPAPVVNARYSVATGDDSNDIVPTVVFDDGRFTYLQFPNNREIPAAFQVNPDGSESLVNLRMERDFLVIDRVSRRLMLRLGRAVVSIANEAYDLDGLPPVEGTTAPGVRRILPRPGGSSLGSASGAEFVGSSPSILPAGSLQ